MDELTRRPLYRLAYWTLTGLLCFQALFAAFCNPGFTGYRRALFGEMIEGRAYKPFVTRALLPAAVRLIGGAVPQTAREAFNQAVPRLPAYQYAVQAKLLRHPPEPAWLMHYAIAGALLWLSLLGFVLAQRALARAVFAMAPAYLDLVTLLTLLGLPMFYLYFNYLYDFPTLFLFTLGLALLARRRWPAFLAVYLLGCLNKETTLLLSLVHYLHFYRRERAARPLHLRLLLAQAVIFIAIKAGLTHAFRDNPGSTTEFWLFGHNLFIGFYSLPAFAACLALGVAVFYRWAEKPLFLKHALAIAVPLLGLTLFLGWLEEIRDYYEVYPVVALLVAHSAARTLGVPMSALPEPPGHAENAPAPRGRGKHRH